MRVAHRLSGVLESLWHIPKSWSRRHQPVRRNFWLQVLGGGGAFIAWRYSSPQLVLPWIGHHLSLAYILIALIFPLFEFGVVIAKLLITPRVMRFAVRKRSVTATGLSLAGAVALVYAATARFSPSIAAVALLSCALMIGIVGGVQSVARSDLRAKTVARPVRGKVMAQGTALGGALTLVVSFVIWALLPDVAGNHIILLWLAVGCWLGFAGAHYALLERPSEPVAEQTAWDQIRSGASLIVEYPWFRRLLIWRALLLSVVLAVPFYAIHAATLNGASAQHLSAFVVATSVGMLLSGPVWGRILDRSTALVGAAGSILAAAAGLFILLLDHFGDPAAPFAHAFIFIPLTLARAGVVQARTRMISVMAPPEHRPAMVAISSAALTVVGIIFALILGAAGHLHDIRTPLVILIVLNVAAAVYAKRVLPS
ncbi:MAG: MFS transporter [Pseudomonadota bacterium]